MKNVLFWSDSNPQMIKHNNDYDSTVQTAIKAVEKVVFLVPNRLVMTIIGTMNFIHNWEINKDFTILPPYVNDTQTEKFLFGHYYEMHQSIFTMNYRVFMEICDYATDKYT